MSSSMAAPETSSDISQLSSDVSKLNINDNNDASELVSNESNTTNTLTTGTVNTYRWADELDDTDSSFGESESEDSQLESESEERGHTKYVVKLSNLGKNTTFKHIREFLPKELVIHHITFENSFNSSALVSFKDDRHMLKALQYSGKITPPNSGSNSKKDNYILIDPWEEPKPSRLDNIPELSLLNRNKFSNLYKSNSERSIRNDSNDRFDFNSSRSLKEETKTPSGERQKLVLKPRSKPLTLDIPPLSKINEHENRTPNIVRKGSESGESKPSNSHKGRSTDSNEFKRNYDKKYSKGEKFDKSDRQSRRDRHSDKYERGDTGEHKSRGVRSGRYKDGDKGYKDKESTGHDDENKKNQPYNKANSERDLVTHGDKNVTGGGRYVKKRGDSPSASADGDSVNQSHKPRSDSQDHKTSDDAKFGFEQRGEKMPKNVEKRNQRASRRKSIQEETQNTNPGDKIVNTDDKRGKNISQSVKPMRRKRQPVT